MSSVPLFKLNSDYSLKFGLRSINRIVLSPTPLFEMCRFQMDNTNYYSTSPYSSTSSSGTRESRMNTPMPAAYSEENSNNLYLVQEPNDHWMAPQETYWNGGGSPPSEYQYHQQSHPAIQPPYQTQLPGISNLMKDSQISVKPASYYSAGSPTMNDYRVEKVTNTLLDPYVHIDQPTYADFTNAQVLSHQQEMLQMNFSNPLSNSYINTAQVAQTQQMPFNIFELNLSNFATFQPACDTSLPVINNSPTHAYTTMNNFTPPPQDPLVVEPKPVKKRMAVRTMQN
ncbi:unnamed protein product [Caenorhabditis brenneri]